MFNDWLLKQLQELDWTQADLSRYSGLTRGAISKYLSGRTPDEAALRKLAKAFKLPPETVFRAAGILPPQSPEDELMNEIMHLAGDLPAQDKQDILEYVRMRNRLAEERGKNESRTQRKPAAP